MPDKKQIAHLHSWISLPWMKSERRAIEILTAFVSDAEHEILAVATLLQVQIDLLHREQMKGINLHPRFTLLDMAIARLVSDVNILASISELTAVPRSKQKQILGTIAAEISTETQQAFKKAAVILSFKLGPDASLAGNAAALKFMIKEMVLTFLHECVKSDTIIVTGIIDKKNLSLSFDTGERNKGAKFIPWQLGQLHLSPTNGEGISLCAVDAIARLHKGGLSVKSLPDQRHEYQLNFSV